MEYTDIQKRLNDLRSRCERTGTYAAGSFMTPAEVLENSRYYPEAVFSGGYDGAERRIAVFVPEWTEREDLDISEYISCLKVDSYYGTPAHRDYMGAILGMGISRDRIGDIVVCGDSAYVFCLKSVEKTILSDLDKAGRITVRVSKIEHRDIPQFERQTRSLSFTVRSLRLDAVCSDMFRISRTKAAEAVKAGLVSLNYSLCEKCDAEVHENDIISFRGKGKGVISEIGGKSRSDRIFVTAEIYK